MRKALVVIALLLAVTLGWFALRRSQSGVESLAPPAALPAAHAEASHALDPLSEEPAKGARQVEPSAVPEKSTPAPNTDATVDGVALRGTIVAIDERGVEHPREDGEFQLVAWKGQGGGGQTVAVRSGAWSARVPLGVLLGCGWARLGGRDAVPEQEVAGQPLRLPIPADGVVALRVRWLRPLRLFVRDRDSNVDLADVTLIRAEGWPRMDYPHPGEITPERVLVASKPSPIPIAPQANRYLSLHVGSPGHAWERLQLDAAEGGERFVMLGPGGDLDLDLVAEHIDASTVVRVRDPLLRVAAEVDVRDRRKLAFEGLPTGKLGVSAEIGNWWKSPIVCGQGEVEVRAGERAHLVLGLGTAPADTSVALGGEVVIPEEWGTKDFLLLVVKLLDPPLGGREGIRRLAAGEMRPDAERAGVWHWRLEGLQAGRYELEVFRFYYSVSLLVPETGLEDVRIEVPKPCEARVRVVDAQSGADADVEMVIWNCRRPEWVHGGGCSPAEWDADARSWRLRAPRGEVELHTRGGDYKELDKLVDLREGTNEVVLEVQRQYSVRLKLVQAGTPVPWPKIVQVKLRPKEGGEEQSFWDSGGGAAFLVVFDHPGKWIVTLPEISGYESVPPFDVRVDPGHASEQTIELVPKG